MNINNFAHRGARSLAPENTMLAIRKAWEIGTQGVEVDVRMTGDGQLVIHHDEALTRTTDAARIYPQRSTHPLSTFSSAELHQLDAGSWFIASDPFDQIKAGHLSPGDINEIPNRRIPHLRELLQYVKGKQWRINLELKDITTQLKEFPFVESVIARIEKEQVDKEKIIISSFNHDYLRIVQRCAPGIEVNALIGGNVLTRNNWGAFEFKIYNANARYISKSQIESAREKGCTVNLYTVNRLSDMKRYINWGVETIITDFPQILAQLQQNDPEMPSLQR